MTVTSPRYGTLHLDYVAGWAGRPDDRPMWALNLMKYRPVADYQDGRESSITGWEADDLYAPVEPLRTVGADIVLVAPVLHHCVGDDTKWDRVAVVRYPSRMAMAELDQLPEFQALHVHKDAGMAFTIVAATYARQGVVPAEPAAGRKLLLELVADAARPQLGAQAGGTLLGRFDVDGVVIGDNRRWAEARWHWLEPDAAAVLQEREPEHTTSAYAVLLDPWLELMADALADEKPA